MVRVVGKGSGPLFMGAWGEDDSSGHELPRHPDVCPTQLTTRKQLFTVDWIIITCTDADDDGAVV